MEYDHMNLGSGIMIVFQMILILGITYWLVSLAQKNKTKPLHADSALEILKKRYARGEISKEQFEQIKKDLI